MKDKTSVPDFLTSKGKLGEIIRNFDWISTPLGPLTLWPQSLKTSVGFMLNSQHPAWISWGTEHTFLCNDACMNLLGTEKQTCVLGKPAATAWEDIWDVYAPLSAKVYNEGISTAIEVNTISVSFSPIFGESGNVEGVFCQQDISTDYTIYKKLKESEAKFRTLVHQTPIGIIILKGKDLIIDLVNESYLAIYNDTPEDIIGRRLTDVLPHLKNSAVEAGLLEVITTGANQEFINRPVDYIDKNGIKTTRYFNSVHRPLIENNEVTGVISIVYEVTKEYLSQKTRELNEKDLMVFLSTMPHIAFRTKPDGMVTYFNDRYFEYTGLTPQEAMDEGWKPTIHPDMLEEVAQKWIESVNTGKDYNAVFLIRRASDGAYRWHMSRGVALRNADGEITEWVGTLTDIHEQKVFEEELEAIVSDRTRKLNKSNKMLAQKNTELEKSNKELESFNYIASHDLQEPLRKIQTFISMIREWEMEGEMADKYLSKIFTSAERMSQLIQDVLIYSRLSVEDQFTETDLHSVVTNVLNDYELAIIEKKAVIEISGLPVINAIPLQMHQMFSNLLSNSLKYCSARPSIEISGKIIHSKNADEYTPDYIEIVFSDNGIGFEPQYREQIFTLFQRLHSKTDYSGTGVGLSICKKIIDQHKGYITAESELGKGAAFTIKLPV